MGKLIRMGAQERRSLWPKRLHWSRPLFLLGMLIIGSTYQYLTSPQDLPTLWAAVSSQHPVKVASRDLSNKEMRSASFLLLLWVTLTALQASLHIEPVPLLLILLPLNEQTKIRIVWRIPGMGEPGGLPSMGSHRVGQQQQQHGFSSSHVWM